jgi:hypothetical protein
LHGVTLYYISTFMSMRGRSQLSVPISPELRARIRRVAASEHRTVANWIRAVILDALAGRPAHKPRRRLENELVAGSENHVEAIE